MASCSCGGWPGQDCSLGSTFTYPRLAGPRGGARTQALTLVAPLPGGLPLQPRSQCAPCCSPSPSSPLCWCPPLSPWDVPCPGFIFTYFYTLHGGCSSSFSQHLGHSWAQSRSSLTGAGNMEMNKWENPSEGQRARVLGPGPVLSGGRAEASRSIQAFIGIAVMGGIVRPSAPQFPPSAPQFHRLKSYPQHPKM